MIGAFKSPDCVTSRCSREEVINVWAMFEGKFSEGRFYGFDESPKFCISTVLILHLIIPSRRHLLVVRFIYELRRGEEVESAETGTAACQCRQPTINGTGTIAAMS